MSGRAVKPFDRTGPANPVFDVYRCGDGTWLAVAVPSDKHWPVYREAVGLERLRDDERFAAAKRRNQNFAEPVRQVECQLGTAQRGEEARRTRSAP